MSSCLTGGGRAAYRLESLNLEIIKSPSATSWISNSPSPSSESSNCPSSISTRKPRTPRKRPNQTYNEAAAILSTAYPKLFPAKLAGKTSFPLEPPPPDLFMPFQVIDMSRHPPVIGFSPPSCHSPADINSNDDDDFDAESILDEEVGEGIDTIMGNLGMDNHPEPIHNSEPTLFNTWCYGYPVGLGLEFSTYGIRRQLRPFRNVDEGNWWRFPCVNVVDVTPKIDKIPAEKKKKKEVEKGAVRITTSSEPAARDDSPDDDAAPGLLLKLNYDGVLNAWSDKGSPFSGDSDAAGNDVQVRLAQIDLFSENGGVREASVLRYKEKRRTRLFSKKIRYQVRKVNADRRPRMKGRFVRTPNAPDD